ncbi:hypothetical protein M0802_010812 [Mischocyttarus mexicanus]|nr:hypothetical protein M0802_010812 [Mischocyttarus mexicanus]
MEDKLNFFLSLTRRIFSNWTALKLAVENGMGSVKTASDFCDFVADYLSVNDDLCSDEIQWFLEEYMENKFNTFLEDQSGQQVADELLKFFIYYAQDDATKALSEFEKLQPLQPWIVLSSVIQRNKEPAMIDSISDSEIDEDDDDDDESMDTDDFGWTKVTSKKNK